MAGRTSETTARILARVRTRFRDTNLVYLAFLLIPLIFLLILVGAPLGFFIWSSFWSTTPGFGGHFTLSGYEIAFTNAAVHETLANTFILAFAGTAIALFIGVLATIVTLRMELPRWLQSALSGLIIVQLLIPNFVHGLSWEFYLGPQGPINRVLMLLPIIKSPVVDANNIWTISFIFGTHYAGLVYLLISGAMRSVPANMAEIAMISGADRRTILREIDLKLVLPSLLVSAVIVIVRGIQAFTLPLILGLPNQVYTLASLMYLELGEYPVNFTFIGALGVIILLLSLWLLALQQHLSGTEEQYETIRGSGEDTRAARFYTNRSLAGSFIVFAFLVYIMPLVMVAIGSIQRAWVGLRPEYIQWSLEGYTGLFFGRWSDIFMNSLTNSAVVGVATGILALLLALMISYMSIKTDRTEGTILSYFSYAPIAIPGIVLASALQWIIFEYNGLFGFLYGSVIILVISFSAKFLVYGVRATNSSLRSVGDNLGEMALISGGSRLTVVREIYGPLIAPGLLAGFIIILIDTTKSLSLPIILGGNQFRLVQSTIWFFITQSELNVAAAYSVLLILGMSALYMIAYKFDLDITSI